MPTYDYICDSCGSIELYRSIDKRNLRATCPKCGDECERVYTMPALKTLAPSVREAMDRNNKSRSDPTVVNRPKGTKLDTDGRPIKSRKAYGGARSWVMESASSSI